MTQLRENAESRSSIGEMFPISFYAFLLSCPLHGIQITSPVVLLSFYRCPASD